MTQDEIAVMDGGKCIFMLRGVRPFFRTSTTLPNTPITDTRPTPTIKMPLTWNGT